jgi:hypothetical protein
LCVKKADGVAKIFNKGTDTRLSDVSDAYTIPWLLWHLHFDLQRNEACRFDNVILDKILLLLRWALNDRRDEFSKYGERGSLYIFDQQQQLFREGGPRKVDKVTCGFVSSRVIAVAGLQALVNGDTRIFC